MQLSDIEKKMVARLQKQQQSQIRWRWVSLLGASMNFAAAVYGYTILQNFLANPEPPAMLAVAILLPMIYVLFGIGAIVLVHVLRYWNGKPETILLLKLIDELNDDDA